ncbi:MAG TPA: hypothetical protein VK166_01035 [Chitinophagaceae bacterium]|nr:hypothetical protein [Chitinophagaceae bacterium]
MASFSLKRTIGRGIALALPLAIVVYVLYKFIKIFEKIMAPIANKFGIEHALGEITLTFFAILAILAIIFLLGLLMQISVVADVRKYVEGWILKFVPSLNHLKLMAAEKMDLDNATLNWKPVLLLKGDQYLPAFIIEENNEWVILGIAKAPGTEPKDMLIVKKNSVSYKEITMKQMHDCNKQFGKGYLSVIN